MAIKPEIILEQASIGILGIDIKGHIQYASPQRVKSRTSHRIFVHSSMKDTFLKELEKIVIYLLSEPVTGWRDRKQSA